MASRICSPCSQAEQCEITECWSVCWSAASETRMGCETDIRMSWRAFWLFLAILLFCYFGILVFLGAFYFEQTVLCSDKYDVLATAPQFPLATATPPAGYCTAVLFWAGASRDCERGVTASAPSLVSPDVEKKKRKEKSFFPALHGGGTHPIHGIGERSEGEFVRDKKHKGNIEHKNKNKIKTVNSGEKLARPAVTLFPPDDCPITSLILFSPEAVRSSY